jgi:hypothetical protein
MAETKEFLKRMQALEDRKKNIMNDCARRVFENFSEHSELQNDRVVDSPARCDRLTG